MQTQISEKIDLFKRGLISDNQEIIGYNQDLHSDFSLILDNYWSSKLQYIVENFITEEDVLSVSGHTDTFPVSGEDFSLEPIQADPEEIQNITGVDFQNDLGIIGSAYETLTSDISGFTTSLYTIMSDSLDDVSAQMVTLQNSLNADIKQTEEQPQFSDGMIEMMKTTNSYLEKNDTKELYQEHLTTSLDAMNLSLTPTETDVILDDIYHTSQAKFGQKINEINTDSLYSLLDDTTVENIISKNVKDILDILCDESFRIAKSTVKLMPDSSHIYNNSTQLELFDTIESLIKEIDIYRDIAIQKGYMDYEQPYCQD